MSRYSLVYLVLFVFILQFTDRARSSDINSTCKYRIDISESDMREFYNKNCDILFSRPVHVWVKEIVAPTQSQADEAYRRIMSGEDFDELIAEYFVPYFAMYSNQGRYINKQVDYCWVQRNRFWDSRAGNNEILDLKMGEISKPVPRFGKGPEYSVFKIFAEREKHIFSFEEVADEIYSCLVDELADTSMLEQVDAGSNPWCGTCRAGHNVNKQLWHVAQKLTSEGKTGEAVSACLLALREARESLEIPNDTTGYYPEEQFLVDHGVDLIRYYAGNVDRVVRGHEVYLHDSLPYRFRQLKDKRVVPLLIKLVDNRDRWSEGAMNSLGIVRAKEAVPTLTKLLADEHIRIVEHFSGGNRSVYAHYYLRSTAKKALSHISSDSLAEVKVIIGDVYGYPLSESLK